MAEMKYLITIPETVWKDVECDGHIYNVPGIGKIDEKTLIKIGAKVEEVKPMRVEFETKVYMFYPSSSSAPYVGCPWFIRDPKLEQFAGDKRVRVTVEELPEPKPCELCVYEYVSCGEWKCTKCGAKR